MNANTNKIGIQYKDVFLIPDFSYCKSRDGINIDVRLSGHTFKSPVVPANMKPVISMGMAEVLAMRGHFYILHRFYPNYQDVFEFVARMNRLGLISSISVGIQERDYQLVDQIAANKVSLDFLTVDVSSAYNSHVGRAVEYYRSKLPNTVIIAGNVMTIEAVAYLLNCGADVIKVGIAHGKSCITYNSTGVGSPMFSTVLECAQSGYPIIADGGIREVGDICKALVAGARMVMVGSEFCRCIDSPTHMVDGKKVYYGSASSRNKGNPRYVEGSEEVLLETNGLTYAGYYDKVADGIRSCMSFAGVENVQQLKGMKSGIFT